MSAVVLEDFYKPFFKRELTDRQANWLMKGVVVGLGALSLGKFQTNCVFVSKLIKKGAGYSAEELQAMGRKGGAECPKAGS